MGSFNKITIVGYLGRDPELRYTPQGKAVCKFSVATTERRNGPNGPEENTTWFRVAAWGNQAEACNRYLVKGRQVYVEGRLNIETYTNREGEKSFSAEVSASMVHFLGGGSDGGANQGSRENSGAADRDDWEQSADNAPGEDDIPF